ncbi:bifunctional phosphopantothenoylcysteine decarboxylase/phosphopantothenate--cysteine ligase CoaBC [Kroppenstedtia pulmonis]|uniref:Coenzyme A biosynthesis bifunctional protein CoaBC n=1 Tax=Kroppenstedtia pulmonis TaxID=1380685 RepID=A0A7D3Y254_9BACL|nr:bifunctional phosphopantothenoylcysteine decarboxylase/phosphopantothenate--cysteine ligase CoaBC [Kroppenstedtia pulmonis]QKG84683.1 bifunctional phosphopantothenoylcysteine decarboxylase/phosphopantothenate--cysteine ligase CoaBC [Kroppenstedtia pulmonis]
MKGKRIVVGVTGGIAVFKAAALVSQLTQRGAEVQVIMTQSATQFVTPLTFQTLSRKPVALDTFEEKDPSVVTHIDIADHADLFVIAPATANILAKLAHGLGDDMLSTTLLATQAPVMIAPAMNVHMYQNPVVQENMEKLRNLGHIFIDPGSGQLACGYVGQGRMEEPEKIISAIEAFFHRRKGKLYGKRILVTAGPTREPIDPVRYLSNRSSGKMGYAIAEEAAAAGGEVVLISGPVHLETPPGVTRQEVMTAKEMHDAVMKELDRADVIIKAAAVADYQPVRISKSKIKKKEENEELKLKKTVDIATEVGKKKGSRLFVGFAAETDHVKRYAQEKLRRKNMDMIVANDVSLPGAGFDGDTNVVTVYDQEGMVFQLPLTTKKMVAKRLIEGIGDRLHGGS